ncbi:MAG TPA: glycosyltransferase family 4 protein [Woeseiaceae bacterium]|nr:glycosyltransferase family 4 protein [Woeseiaceae bacterium]
MRVLLLNYEFPPVGGGAGHATANIAAGLVRLGIEAEVLTSRLDGEEDGALVDGVPVHRVRSWRVGVHHCGLRGAYTYVLSAAGKLRRLRKERGYDLEHYFFSLPTGLLTLMPQMPPRTPYVVSLRGSDVPGYDPYNTRVERLHGILKPITRRIWSNAGRVVALSKALADTARRTAPDLDIEVIPNGIDPERFSPPAERRVRKVPRLITVARLLERKGIQTILEACARPTVLPVELSIVGTGPYENELKQMVRSLGLDDRVRFLGFVPNEELPNLYRESDIFVLPSETESFGLVFAEAMSCGLPIAASNVGGIPETVRDGVDGLLCPPGEPLSLRENILRLMSNVDTRREISHSQRERILERYSWEQIAARYADVYHAVLARERPSRLRMHSQPRH